MPGGTWKAVYDNDLIAVYGLVVVPALFLIWLLAFSRPAGDREGRFVRAWAFFFTLETIADPLVTGVGVRWLGLAGAYDLVLIPFVLLGDFRAFLLVAFLRAPERGIRAALAEAAAWTVVVPVAAWAGTAALQGTWRVATSTTLWLVYETAFTILALGLRQWLVPADGYLRAVLAYVAIYYALWAAADVLILAGLDVGWALRLVPNQLYYGFWVPFAYVQFFSRRYVSTSTSTHVSR